MFIVANFKMNLNLVDYKNLVKKLKINAEEDTELILCPPFVYLPVFCGNNNLYSLGAQNVSAVESGRCTGQVSAKMLKDFNVKYCIVGHSERRGFESNIEIAGKIRECLKCGITPILCVGEKIKDEGEDVLVEQVRSAVAGLKNGEQIIVAYEPIWAISSGNVPTNAYINKKIAMIKRALKEFGFNFPILYGGSVNEKNCNTIKKCKIDGFLLGGLSLQFDKLLNFRRIVCEKVY